MRSGRPEFSRSRKLLSRFLVLALIGFLCARIAPTLADEFATVPTQESASPSTAPTGMDSSSANPSPEVTPEVTKLPIPSDPLPNSSPTISVSQVSASPSPIPTVMPALSQKFQLHFPESVPVDPRAHTLLLPQSNLDGAGSVLVCLSTFGSNLDLFNIGQADSKFDGVSLIDGDLTPQVLVTGSLQQVNSLMNGNKGISIFNFERSVSYDQILIRVIGISAASLNPNFCSSALPENTRIISIKPLELTLNMRKGDITLKR